MVHSLLFATAVLFSSLLRGTECAPITPAGAKALYFIDNLVPNNIIAVKVGSDGLLSDGAVVPTGGKGGNMMFAGTTTPAIPAALDSTGAVTVYKNFLLAVNAGSNTVSMFKINPNSPTDLTPIGEPINTQGDFPNTIAVSTTLQQACVGSTGVNSGIECFGINDSGLQPISSFIPYFVNQTNPPLAVPLIGLVPDVRPMITSISFTPNSSSLIATVPGSISELVPGRLVIYPVINGIVTNTPQIGAPPGIAAPFSIAYIPGTNKVLVADAAEGGAIVDLGSPSSNSTIIDIPIPRLGATCWSTISPVSGTGFIADAIVNQIAEVDVTTGELIQRMTVTNGNLGNLDIVSAGDKVYAMSPGITKDTTRVVVMDVSGGRGTAKVVQAFAPKGLGPTPFAYQAGLAWY